MVKVLPEPVTPSTCSRSPARTPSVSQCVDGLWLIARRPVLRGELEAPVRGHRRSFAGMKMAGLRKATMILRIVGGTATYQNEWAVPELDVRGGDRQCTLSERRLQASNLGENLT
jgi:hypothetical protein